MMRISELYSKTGSGSVPAWLQTLEIQYAQLSYDRCDLNNWPDATFW
jgi:hypothetical protein